jgi:hypothetical protein
MPESHAMSTLDDNGSHDRPRCGAKTDHGPCGLPAGWGTNHVGSGACKLHGGNMRNHVIAANRRKATNAVATFGLPREIDPQTALLEEVHRTAGHVAYLQSKIAGFETDDELKQLDMSERFEKPAVWVEMYEGERRHLVRVAKACIDAGIAERAVRLAEDQGRQLANVLRDVVADLFVLIAKVLLALLAAHIEASVLEAVQREMVRIQREEVPAVIRARLTEVVEASG